MNFKTSQSKTLKIFEKMLSDLKVKTEGTSSSTPAARTISKNEILFDENSNSDNVSSVSAKKIFDDDLLEIKRFVGNPKPMSFTKNWYSRPTPPDMRFEERYFQTQFSVSTDKLSVSIKHAVKKNDEGFPIFDESIGCGIPDGVNTLIYTILKHFVGTPSNISS